MSSPAIARHDSIAPTGNAPVCFLRLIRSSATAEDLPGASFAGQQETFLNVIGIEALLAAVQQCLASLWTDRAITYRASLGIAPRCVRLAVVVQRRDGRTRGARYNYGRRVGFTRKETQAQW